MAVLMCLAKLYQIEVVRISWYFIVNQLAWHQRQDHMSKWNDNVFHFALILTKVVDKDPTKKVGQFEDLSAVEKYEMDTEEYAKRTG